MEPFFCVCVCLCLCLSLYGREVTVGYARLRGGMGATFCHLAALRSAIEFLFWDHCETAVLSQILAGRRARVRSREVMGGYRGGKRQEKGWKRTKKNEGKSLNTGGKWRRCSVE